MQTIFGNLLAEQVSRYTCFSPAPVGGLYGYNKKAGFWILRESGIRKKAKNTVNKTAHLTRFFMGEQGLRKIDRFKRSYQF